MVAKNSTDYPIPRPDADFAATWAFLEAGLDRIMTKPQTGMSYHEYMALSTASYNYCISPSPTRKFLQIHDHTTPFRSFFPFALRPAQLTDDLCMK